MISTFRKFRVCNLENCYKRKDCNACWESMTGTEKTEPFKTYRMIRKQRMRHKRGRNRGKSENCVSSLSLKGLPFPPTQDYGQVVSAGGKHGWSFHSPSPFCCLWKVMFSPSCPSCFQLSEFRFVDLLEAPCSFSSPLPPLPAPSSFLPSYYKYK